MKIEFNPGCEGSESITLLAVNHHDACVIGKLSAKLNVRTFEANRPKISRDDTLAIEVPLSALITAATELKPLR
jgi:hypothetical protein